MIVHNIIRCFPHLTHSRPFFQTSACKVFRTTRPNLLSDASTSVLPPIPCNRHLSQSTYDGLFSPDPFIPTLWNNSIWLAQTYFSGFSQVTGLSWGWTIVGGTLLIRSLITFPLLIANDTNQVKLAKLYSEMESHKIRMRLTHEIEELLKRGNVILTPEQKAEVLNRERKNFLKKQYAEKNCHPGKRFVLPFIQIPLWFACSIALRNMCGAFEVDGVAVPPTYPELTSEPFLWMSDLTSPDTSLTISLLLALSYLVLIEMNVYKNFQGEKMGKIGLVVTNLMRVVGIVVLPCFAYFVPATVSVYWLTSALSGLSHNLILMSPKVRRRFGLALTSESRHPYKDIVVNFRRYWKV